MNDQPPSGYDPTVSSLPDPGAAAVPMKAMMGGGNTTHNDNKSDNKSLTTITILGEPYRIRSQIKDYPLEDDEERLLKAFHVGPDEANRKRIGKDTILSFFHAMANYNCEKEEGVLLNPKCEPVRAILRSAFMGDFLKNMDDIRAARNLGPLKELLDEDLLKRRNKVDVLDNITDMVPSAPNKPTSSLLDKILSTPSLLKERYKLKGSSSSSSLSGSDKYDDSTLEMMIHLSSPT